MDDQSTVQFVECSTADETKTIASSVGSIFSLARSGLSWSRNGPDHLNVAQEAPLEEMLWLCQSTAMNYDPLI